MSIWEIIGGVAMILMSIFIVIFVLLQQGTKGGGIAALSGGEVESFFNKNQGRTREAMLYKATKICAVLFFLITIGVYAIYVISNR